MTSVTIIGAGNIGGAVARLALKAGADVQVLARDAAKAAAVDPAVTAGTVGDAVTGDVVVLALPYPALAEVAAQYPDGFAGRVVVETTNPVDFATFDSLVVPAGWSATAELAALLPEARVLKAFSTNFAATLASGSVGALPTTVLIAGDDADAKAALAGVVEGGGLRAVDAGSLKRARELEALGFLQMTLAASEQTSWTSGFALER
ncbi:NAD(P)-binding domain-containing protein [Cellulomonas sp. IC4_254]|uniref:NADPH-dependent F420 reductase n=1 Tax=Cellulomonas sp. IC4_254 TaxID=2714040 RepID=UPI00141E5BBE|nr:NAD(P)-binding domain-containing protein [Cellulomonas sp. IC4_254]NHT17112.1 NAD(P)-binding domain-containing protein [Cellulomonas sp. IC4_254]